MKTVKLYFGAKQESTFFSNMADTITLAVPDQFSVTDFLAKTWSPVAIDGGTKYINTSKILWFEIYDKSPEELEAERKAQYEASKTSKKPFGDGKPTAGDLMSNIFDSIK